MPFPQGARLPDGLVSYWSDLVNAFPRFNQIVEQFDSHPGQRLGISPKQAADEFLIHLKKLVVLEYHALTTHLSESLQKNHRLPF